MSGFNIAFRFLRLASQQGNVVKQRNYRPVLVTLAMAMFVAPLQPSFGGVIGTQQYLVANDRDAALARVNTVLARAEVRARLEQLGVDPVAAQERIAALTDEELQLLATDLENLPRAAVSSPLWGLSPSCCSS